LPKIEHSIEIHASQDRVWEIISDLDNEADYWYGTSNVRTISKESDFVINREITQNFRKHRILQKAFIHPKDSIEIKYLKGLTEGVKIVSISETTPGIVNLKAYWDVHFPGIYVLVSPIIGRHISKGTVNALERIKAAAEGRPLPDTESEKVSKPS